jgi:hypothetical protein
MGKEQHLFIVASDLDDLCAYLRREFSTEDNVQIFLDRRRAERRERLDSGPGAVQDRRASQRRGRPFVDSKLRSLGYAMLRVS